MIDDERLPGYILVASLLLLIPATLTGYLAYSQPVGNGVLAGGARAIINFIWQRRTLTRILGQQPSSAGSALIRYLFRLSLTGLVLYFILTSERVSVFALLAGLSIIVAVIVFFALYAAFYKGD